MTIRTSMLLSAATLGVVAGLASAANLRVVHGSPDAPAVDILVNGATGPAPLTNFSFGDVTDYVSIPAGNYDIGVAPTGTTSSVFDLNNFAVPAAGDFTIVALNRLANFDVELLADDNTLDPNNARVRFFHGALDAPEVDIVAVDGNGDALVTLATLSYRDTSSYVSVAAGTYDLQVRLTGTTTSVLSLNDIALNANTVYSAFALGLVQPGAGEPGFGVVLSVDAVPTPGAAGVLGAGALFAMRRRRGA
jgi:MYXO-CTERM domain-containing protein